jgi:hypothetical protein
MHRGSTKDIFECVGRIKKRKMMKTMSKGFAVCLSRDFFLALLALTWTPALATDLSLSPLDVIHKNGQLIATDGKSRCTLKKDGSFSSFPLAETGFATQGKWKFESLSQGLTVVVDGHWFMVNALWPNDDVRTMKLAIHSGVLRETGNPQTDTYKCSFTIEDMNYELHLPSLKMAPLPPVKMTVDGLDIQDNK